MSKRKLGLATLIVQVEFTLDPFVIVTRVGYFSVVSCVWMLSGGGDMRAV
jgi:hypothetical protein